MFPVHGSQQLLGRTQRILLEVCTLLFFFAKNSAIPLVQQYIYFLVANKYNFTAAEDEALPALIANASHHEGNHSASNLLTKTWSNSSIEPKHGNTTVPTDAAQASTLSPAEIQVETILEKANRVNAESTMIILYLNVAELFPAVITVLFMGCWSDWTGRRKFLMWMPCFGNAIYALGFLLPLYISNGDLDHPATKALFVLASVCSGLSGSVPGFLSGNASYISDTDSPRRRTLRLAIVELSIGLTFGIANLMNGFWVNYTSHFDQPLWFVFGCSMVPGLCILFILKEPHGEVSSQLGPTTSTVSWKDFRGIRHVFGFKTLPQKKLWAIFLAFQIYVFVQQGQERTFVLFLQNYPLYWRAIKIGLFLFVLYTVSGFGSWPGVPLLQKITDDATIAILAMLSKLIGSILLAFAEVEALVYVASIVHIFHLTPYAVSRSMASLQAGEDEQGAVYAMLHSAQSIMGFLGPVAHNALFVSTVQQMDGLVFLVSGPILVIPMALLLYVKHLDRVEQGYMSMEGSKPPPLSSTPPGSMTPLSEASSFVQRPAQDFGSTNEAYH